VSTRAATCIKVLPPPAALDLMRLPSVTNAAHARTGFRFAPTLPFGGLVKELEALLNRSAVAHPAPRTGRHDPDRFVSGNPVEFVTRPDAVAIRNRLRNGQLQFTCDLRHMLTLARMESLSSPCPCHVRNPGIAGLAVHGCCMHSLCDTQSGSPHHNELANWDTYHVIRHVLARSARFMLAPRRRRCDTISFLAGPRTLRRTLCIHSPATRTPRQS
jgi:hypothetical protein